jgi:sec-independent protein translocase protein TatB
MFGLGALEIIVILVLALIVLGPQKLPVVARQLARYLGELRRVADDVRRNFDEATRDDQHAFRSILPADHLRDAEAILAEQRAMDAYHTGEYLSDTPPPTAGDVAAGAVAGAEVASSAAAPAAQEDAVEPSPAVKKEDPSHG